MMYEDLNGRWFELGGGEIFLEGENNPRRHVVTVKGAPFRCYREMRLDMNRYAVSGP